MDIITDESHDAQALAEQYASAVKELQEALREASDRFGDLETNSERDKVRFNSELERRNQIIAALKQELKSANTLLEQKSEGRSY